MNEVAGDGAGEGVGPKYRYGGEPDTVKKNNFRNFNYLVEKIGTLSPSVLIIKLAERRGDRHSFANPKQTKHEEEFMTIRPLYDRIVVKRIEQKEQMQGGLYIPDSA